MYDKDFAELVKIAAEKLKEDTVYKMLTRSEDYQKESDERDKAERNYEQLDLTMEQRKVCDVFLDYRDRQSLEYSDYSYLTNSSSTLVSRLDICLKKQIPAIFVICLSVPAIVHKATSDETVIERLHNFEN